MGSTGPHVYTPPHIQQPTQQMQYQLSPYPNPYSPGTLYANSLISAYGQLPATAPPLPPPQAFMYDQPSVGTKRPQDDVDLLSKRPRLDSGGALGFYPQRPGEKVCAYYMTTRTCSFGHTCKFDHPVWVPFGGIPNWKEVTGSANAIADPATLPQRAGEQDCAFYMRTGDCKYGQRCRFNHPKERPTALTDTIPQTKDEESHLQNGVSADSDGVGTEPPGSSGPVITETVTGTSLVPVKASEKGHGKPVSLNSKGLPFRQNEMDCTYYIKTGSCKFGATCRFHHPEGVLTVARPVPFNILPQSIPVPGLSYSTSDLGNTSAHPQRPGGLDCTYYLKTGECSFGATCKFHHPPNRQPSNVKAPLKLTLAGLPRREGEVVCAYYMKTGACKYGSTCRFDHPPPGEVAAKAAAKASRTDPPSVLEVIDAHQSQGVPLYVDLNPVPTVSDTTVSTTKNEGRSTG